MKTINKLNVKAFIKKTPNDYILLEKNTKKILGQFSRGYEGLEGIKAYAKIKNITLITV